MILQIDGHSLWFVNSSSGRNDREKTNWYENRFLRDLFSCFWECRMCFFFIRLILCIVGQWKSSKIGRFRWTGRNGRSWTQTTSNFSKRFSPRSYFSSSLHLALYSHDSQCLYRRIRYRPQCHENSSRFRTRTFTTTRHLRNDWSTNSTNCRWNWRWEWFTHRLSSKKYLFIYKKLILALILFFSLWCAVFDVLYINIVFTFFSVLSFVSGAISSWR